MSQTSLWHQIESDKRLIEQLPQGERVALQTEVSWSAKNCTSYRFERAKEGRK